MEHFTPESLFAKLKNVKVSNPLCHYTLDRCHHIAPLINEINVLKQEKNALILAHSYVHPDIIYGVADAVGDSYFLAKKAMNTSAERIIFPAVRFMAETAKILNPDKTVIDPNPHGGCSLADSISGDDVKELRVRYPNHTFVCYINTTAEVKAACDVCVTSSNVYNIIEALPSEHIYFLPDKLMGENIKQELIKRGCQKEILVWEGTCYVHEGFEQDQVEQLKKMHPTLKVLAHPECKPEVASCADVVASTSGILEHINKSKSAGHPFLILTECGIAARLQIENPDVDMLGSCLLCKYMKSNSLETIKQALVNPTDNQIINVSEKTREGAKQCLEMMFHYARLGSVRDSLRDPLACS